MCGRFANSESIPTIAMRWKASISPGAEVWQPGNDIRPANQIPILLEGGGKPRRLGLMAWGWARDFATHGHLINARAEDAHFKPTFADAVVHRRCLVPATAWFEWQADSSRPKAKKVKYRLAPADMETWAFAGLWEPIPGEQRTAAVVVMTTAAHASVAAIHDRMPALIAQADATAWLDGPVEAAMGLARPVEAVAEAVA